MLVDKYPWLLEPNLLVLVIRTILALICAGVIGFERDANGSAAGLRTHILVCFGAMIAMTTGVFTATHFSGDASRIGAQVVSGIGFLGAGTIMVNRGHIKGLTTAAGLWASACIGLAIGTGFYEAAIVGTVAVFFVERGLKDWSKKIMQKHGHWDEDSVLGAKEVDKIE
ncbi:MAG: MgtC/SapB family protein [Mogibacterium sp.]|nr:MgtC/SapB family protein [Mogibacterium sp.]